MKVETGTEAVAAIIEGIDHLQGSARLRRHVANMIESLTAERDAATVRVEKAEEAASIAREAMMGAERDRDAAHARAERLEVALRHIAGISNECTWHAHTRKLAADLQDTIRAALAAQEGRDGE